MRGFWAGVGLGAMGGAVTGLLGLKAWEKQQEQPTPAAGAMPASGQVAGTLRRPAASPFKFHAALKHGPPTSELLRFYDGYVACLDPARRNPKWVLEKLSRAELAEGTEGDRAKSDFFEDAGVDPRFRSRLDDYKGSGYDRGHMAPASNHRGSQEKLNQTFCLSNIAPQVGKGFNRDYWARLERFVQGLAKRGGDVYVVTGPLYLPKPGRGGKLQMAHEVLGSFPCTVEVPTHFFKVVLVESQAAGDSAAATAVGAFVLPNQPLPAAMPLSCFVVPLEVLEAAAGMSFFPQFLSPERRVALDTAAAAVREEGRREAASLVGGGSASRLLLDLQDAAPEQAGSDTPAARPPASRASEPSQPGPLPLHLCRHTACKLPAEDYWLKSKAAPS